MYGYRFTDLPTYLMYLLKKSKCIKTLLNIEDQVKMKHSILLDRISSENVFLSFFFFLFHFSFFSFSESVESVSSSARV